jgi:hypothetical protein
VGSKNTCLSPTHFNEDQEKAISAAASEGSVSPDSGYHVGSTGAEHAFLNPGNTAVFIKSRVMACHPEGASQYCFNTFHREIIANLEEKSQ